MSDARNIPEYLKNEEFNQEELIGVFKGDIQINENIDDTGNQIIDMNRDDLVNNVSIISQSRTEYSSDKIEQSYETNFSELLNESEIKENIMIEDDIKQLSEDQLKREAVLENQLDELSKVLERESQKNIKMQEDAEQNYKAMKSVIVEQRIKNGEGKSESDFKDSFPFLPKNSSNAKDDTSFNPSPYAIDPT